MGGAKGSTDSSPEPSTPERLPALGGPEPPLAHGEEAGLCLRSSELGLSLRGEPPTQAPATAGGESSAQQVPLPGGQKRLCLGGVGLCLRRDV